MFFSTRNYWILRTLWVGALSWWSSHNLSCHNSHLFSYTKQSRCHRIFFECFRIVWSWDYCGWDWITVDDDSLIKKHDQHVFVFWISCFLCPWWSQTSTVCSDAWFSSRTQKSTSYHLWWFYDASLVQFEDAWCCNCTWCYSKYLVIIFQTLYFLKSIWLAIIPTVKWALPYTICLTHLILTLVLLVKSLPLLESFFTSFQHSLNLL